jgi:hypothetical protein
MKFFVYETIFLENKSIPVNPCCQDIRQIRLKETHCFHRIGKHSFKKFGVWLMNRVFRSFQLFIPDSLARDAWEPSRDRRTPLRLVCIIVVIIAALGCGDPEAICH